MQALHDRVAEYTKAYLPDSLIVKFRPGTSLTAQRTMLALVDGTSSTSVPNADFEIVTTQPGVDPEQAAARLAAQPDVEYAQARYRIRPQFVPNDSVVFASMELSGDRHGARVGHQPGATSSIVVAVLDTGIAYRGGTVRYSTTNPLAQLVFPGVSAIDVLFAAAPDLGPTTRFVSPRDFIWNNTLPLDLEGHGTHVAGTIGGLTNNGLGVAGMAFNVSIMPVKVIGGDWDIILALQGGTDDSVAQGIRYAVDNGARVLNMSIGRTGPPSPVIQSALTYAVSQGAFAAVAAGNDFLPANQSKRPPISVLRSRAVITVGAIGRTRTRRAIRAPARTSKSPPGRRSVLRRRHRRHSAADVRLRFRVPLQRPSAVRRVHVFLRTGHIDGHRARDGFAALLMQQGITNPAAIEAAMKRYATESRPVGRDDQFGNGLINVRATLRGMGLAK
jgi:hypothetical protein